MNRQQWQLGQLIFDPQRRTLQLHGQHCALEPRQAELLLLLAQHAGEPVSREQLISEIWLGRVVSESAINRAVSFLRKACASLDPDTDYISTIPKLGYCLLPNARLLASTSNTVTTPIDSPEISAAAPEVTTAKPRSLLLWPLLMFSLIALVASWAWLQTAAPDNSKPGEVLIPKPVTSFDGAEFNISSSLQGQLLYHRRDANGNTHMWLYSNQQHTPLITADVQAVNGSISPDGSKVVYRQLNGEQCQILLLALQPQAPEQSLFACPADSAFQASWHPDSQQFYYRLRQSKTQPYLVYRYQLATANQQQLTLPDPASVSGAIALAVAADGKQLAVASYLTPDSSRLSLYQLAEGQPLQLQQATDLNIGVVDLTWPAGKPMLLASSNQVYRLKNDLSLQHYFYSQLSINSLSSSGRQLFFASQQQQAEIWRKPFTTDAQATPHITSSQLDILPRVNQQDSELLFLSTRQGLHQIWRKPHNGQEHLLATLPASAGFTRLSWSNDQRSVYFSQQGAVYQLDLANSQLTPLFMSEHMAYVVNAGPDNNNLIYSSNKSGDWQLWRYQLTGKQHQQLTTQGGYSGYLVGDVLYYSKFHQDGLWQLDLSNGEELLLLADFDKINWLNWQLQDNRVLYFKPGQGIYRQSLQNNAPAEQLLADSPELVHHYSVSNQAIYFVKRQPAQGDVYQLPLP
jgi:DNA-binding winged helix-turn-helix (wHTH) protein/Tol biopolymer transport system component